MRISNNHNQEITIASAPEPEPEAEAEAPAVIYLDANDIQAGQSLKYSDCTLRLKDADKLIINGGSSDPIPEFLSGATGRTTWLKNGIYINCQNVTFDFEIEVQDCLGHGIVMHSQSRHCLFPKKITLHNNGYTRQATGDMMKDFIGTYPTGTGLVLNGDRHEYAWIEAFDNGQDAIQCAHNLGDAESIQIDYLEAYNTRPHSQYPKLPFNAVSHSDGLQIYVGSIKSLNIREALLGPLLTNGIIASDTATIDNLEIGTLGLRGGMENGVFVQNGNISIDHLILTEQPINQLVYTGNGQSDVGETDHLHKAFSLQTNVVDGIPKISVVGSSSGSEEQELERYRQLVIKLRQLLDDLDPLGSF